jgi:hypothetical protein
MERGEPPTLVNVLQMTHGSQAGIELVHVPLVLKAPGLDPARVGAWVENVDIGPTLLALCGIAPPATMQGRGLLDAKARTEAVFSFTRFHTSTISQEGMQLLQPTPQGECAFGLTAELYDLGRDPEARKDLLAQRQDVARRLSEFEAKRQRDAAIRGGSGQVGPDTLKSLAGLGYIDSGVMDVLGAELEAATTDEILERLQTPNNCLVSLQMVRALKGRELGEPQRAVVRGILEKESSPTMQAALRGLLPR